MEKVIDRAFLDTLCCQASESPRLRMNFDMRNSSEDTSQRMLNALLPGTVVPVHRHEATNESVICLCGKLEVIIYEELIEYERVMTSGLEDVVKKHDFVIDFTIAMAYNRNCAEPEKCPEQENMR